MLLNEIPGLRSHPRDRYTFPARAIDTPCAGAGGAELETNKAQEDRCIEQLTLSAHDGKSRLHSIATSRANSVDEIRWPKAYLSCGAGEPEEMNMRRTAAAILVLGLTSAAALAHHGWGSYDSSKKFTIEAPVEMVSWQNPHSHVMLNYEGVTWEITLAPVSRLGGAGSLRRC